MPPANPTPSSFFLDDAAAAVVLIEPDDLAGWEKARATFLENAEKAPPPIKECLKSVADKLKDFKDRSDEERGPILAEVQQLIQTTADTQWEATNVGLPKETKVDEPSPPYAPPKPLNIPPAPPPSAAGPPPAQAVDAQPAAPPPVPPTMSAPEKTAPPTNAPPRVTGGKFLTFFLAKEEYGFEILKVHEIITLMPITPVPRTPSHLLGVINLRGKIIPVVDLRIKLGLPPLKDQDCIIIVQAHNMEVGVSVDRVSEVANVPDNDIGEVPSFGEGTASQDLLGIAKSNNHVRLLLDIDKVLAPEHLMGAPEGQTLVRGDGR